MKKNLLILCAILIMLSSCGPTIRVGYDYIPPADPEEKNCVASCHIQKQKCEQRSERDYHKCYANNGGTYYDGAFVRYEPYDTRVISCKKYDCVQSYNECFRLCGGEVESYVYEEY